jgi:hypothetical protein
MRLSLLAQSFGYSPRRLTRPRVLCYVPHPVPSRPRPPGQMREEVEHRPGDGAPRQRQGDRQKGEVVPHGDGEDPGEGHLQDERAHAGQEDDEKVTTV